jgi:REP element-mobilizing transposase RayT
MTQRRCCQRLNLLPADEETVNNLIYCLVYAANKYGIDIIAWLVEGNHDHLCGYDPDGRFPDFLRLFRSLVARSQNALLRRCENLWNSNAPSEVRVIETVDLVEKCVYALANPIKDRLVEEVDQWPCASTWAAMNTPGRVLSATRPKHFFSDKMPERVELTLKAPPGVDADEFFETVRRRVHEVEEQERKNTAADARRPKHKRTLRKVLGRAAILGQAKKRVIVRSPQMTRELNPRIACRNPVLRKAAIEEDRAFYRAHAEARARWLAGDRNPNFPPGTFALRHLIGPDKDTRAPRS